MSRRLIWTQAIPTFLCLLLETLSSKMCGLKSIWSFLLSFVCLWTPTVYKTCDFLARDLVSISLLIPSYLSTITLLSIVQRTKFVSFNLRTFFFSLSFIPFSVRTLLKYSLLNMPHYLFSNLSATIYLWFLSRYVIFHAKDQIYKSFFITNFWPVDNKQKDRVMIDFMCQFGPPSSSVTD